MWEDSLTKWMNELFDRRALESFNDSYGSCDVLKLLYDAINLILFCYGRALGVVENLVDRFMVYLYSLGYVRLRRAGY